MENNQKQNDVIEIDLFELFNVLISRIWLLFGVGLLFALIAMAVSMFVITPKYESTTKIYILNKQENTSVTYSDVQIGTQLTKDYAELINSRYVLEEVIRKQNLVVDYKELIKRVRVSTPTDTRIVTITVTDVDQVVAMNIANCIREVASEHIQNVMDIEAVNVVETANMPTEKSSPSVLKWTFIGGIAGVLLVCGVILMRYLLDDTVKSSEDIERYLGLSTLALIPVMEEVKQGAAPKKKKGR